MTSLEERGCPISPSKVDLGTGPEKQSHTILVAHLGGDPQRASTIPPLGVEGESRLVKEVDQHSSVAILSSQKKRAGPVPHCFAWAGSGTNQSFNHVKVTSLGCCHQWASSLLIGIMMIKMIVMIIKMMMMMMMMIIKMMMMMMMTLARLIQISSPSQFLSPIGERPCCQQYSTTQPPL